MVSVVPSINESVFFVLSFTITISEMTNQPPTTGIDGGVDAHL